MVMAGDLPKFAENSRDKGTPEEDQAVVKNSIPIRPLFCDRLTTRPRASLRGGAAVDDEAGTGHEGGIIRGEKDDAFGDVGHGAEAADRQPLQ
jgi:hypothetical protein